MRPQSINGKFRYSEALIKEIKELFPDDADIRKMADEGSYDLEREYVTYKNTPFSEEVVLKADSLEELQSIARLSKRKRDIHDRCRDERKLFSRSKYKREGASDEEAIINTLRCNILITLKDLHQATANKHTDDELKDIIANIEDVSSYNCVSSYNSKVFLNSKEEYYFYRIDKSLEG